MTNKNSLPNQEDDACDCSHCREIIKNHGSLEQEFVEKIDEIKRVGTMVNVTNMPWDEFQTMFQK